MIANFPFNAINDGTWFASGVAATLVAAYTAHRIGRIQISLMRKEHALNVHRATPKIIVEVRLEDRTPNPSRPDVRRYFLVITIANEGEVAAEKLDGNWNLSCSESVHNRTVPITRDYVSYRRPYQLEPYEFGGMAITEAIRSGRAQIKVDIDFNFFGLDDKTPKHYGAKYEYSHEHKEMIRR